MGLAEILILSLLALLLGWLAPRRRLAGLLLIAGVLAIFWMQSASPLRGLDFWLPFLAITLTAIAWAASLPPKTATIKTFLPWLALTGGLILLISLGRYAGPLCCLTASRPPAPPAVIAAWVLAAALPSLIAYFPQYARRISWVLLALLLVLFVVLKTPALAALAAAGWRLAAGQDIALVAPTDLVWTGYSFLAFRLIHTLRDSQTGKLPAAGFHEYAAYALFFPAVVAGPIDRLPRALGDLHTTSLDAGGRLPVAQRAADTAAGAKRILIGVFKKFVLADSLAIIALNPQNALQVQSPVWMWALLLAYSLRIYFDFAGYTDIALGMGRLMGFRLPENFNRPYLKTSLTAFWNSWHITLAQWFRAYLFNPLLRWLRTRPKKIHPAAMIFIGQTLTMALIGLWHGVTWNFLIWGLWHGVGLFVQNRWSEWIAPRLDDLPDSARWIPLLRAGGWAATFVYVMLGWVWFALPNFSLSQAVFQKLFGF